MTGLCCVCEARSPEKRLPWRRSRLPTGRSPPACLLSPGGCGRSHRNRRHVGSRARMNIDLTGRTALVTGSTAGIGLATARGLAERGAIVWVNGRTRQRVDAAVSAIGASCAGARLHGVVADLATPDGAEAVVRA